MVFNSYVAIYMELILIVHSRQVPVDALLPPCGKDSCLFLHYTETGQSVNFTHFFLIEFYLVINDRQK